MSTAAPDAPFSPVAEVPVETTESYIESEGLKLYVKTWVSQFPLYH